MLRVKHANFKRNLTLTTIVFNKSLSAQCVVLGAIVVESMWLEHILSHLLRSLKMGNVLDKFAYLQKKQYLCATFLI